MPLRSPLVSAKSASSPQRCKCTYPQRTYHKQYINNTLSLPSLLYTLLVPLIPHLLPNPTPSMDLRARYYIHIHRLETLALLPDMAPIIAVSLQWHLHTLTLIDVCMTEKTRRTIDQWKSLLNHGGTLYCWLKHRPTHGCFSQL